MRLRTRILLLAAGFLFIRTIHLHAQTDQSAPAGRIIYWEALGIGGYQSLNYERMVFRALGNHVMGSFAIGASCLISHKPRDPEIRFYLLQRANLAFGRQPWYLETGLDLILDRGRAYSPQIHRWMAWSSNFSLFYHFGVKYQKRVSGPYFKVYFFPIKDNGWTYYFLTNIGKDTNPISEYPRTFWWGGFAAGYTF